MSCKTYDEIIEAYFERGLDSSERSRLEAHLDACSECRLDFALYDRVFSYLESLEEVEPPADFTSSVMKRIRALELTGRQQCVRPEPWWKGVAWRAATAVAVVVLVLSAIFLGGRGDVELLPVESPVAMVEYDLGSSNEAPVPPAVRNGAIGVVVSGSGVEVLSNGGTQWRLVERRDVLGFGDRIRTNGCEARLLYPDRTWIKLKPHTMVQLLVDGLRLKAGATWVRVVKRGRHFAVHTPNAVASVKGTIFSVEFVPEDERTRVEVFESSVLVESLGRDGLSRGAVLVGEGHGVDVDWSGPGMLQVLDASAYIAWNMVPPAELIRHDAAETAESTAPVSLEAAPVSSGVSAPAETSREEDEGTSEPADEEVTVDYGNIHVGDR